MIQYAAKDTFKWLDLAAAHKKDAAAQPVLGKVWAQSGHSIAADGCRMHVVRGAVDGAQDRDASRAAGENVPDFYSMIPRHSPNVASVSTFALAQAVTACKPFARDGGNMVRLYVNGALEVSAVSAELGDCAVTLKDGDEWATGKTRTAYLRNVDTGKRIAYKENVKVKVTYQHDGAAIECAYNWRYLLDALAGLGDLVTLRWAEFNAADKPLLMTGSGYASDRSALLMPMHIRR